MIYAFQTCSVCGKSINWERLRVLPETRRCVQCSEEYGTDAKVDSLQIGMDPDTYKDLLGAVRS